MKRRLFVAVTLDESARRACAAAAARLRDAGFAARWTTPESYHLTVAFLGGVEAERVGEVEAALCEAASRVAPFDVRIDALGGFPDERRPRIVWAGPTAPVAPFAAACVAVRARLETLGFRFDLHDDAHVTLARADGRAALPPVVPPRAEQPADALTLFESFTDPGGARYVALRRFACGG